MCRTISSVGGDVERGVGIRVLRGGEGERLGALVRIAPHHLHDAVGHVVERRQHAAAATATPAAANAASANAAATHAAVAAVAVVSGSNKYLN